MLFRAHGDIPVFHDDQHGTAIILAAALLNSLEIIGKRLDGIKVVFSGAGAAGIACANQLRALGVPCSSIWLTDAAGLVYAGRCEEMFPEKLAYARGDRPATLAQVLRDAAVFIGVSAAHLVSPEMLKSMPSNPIVFAMANPHPEINFELARATRPDAIVATGRSATPNQIHNVLGFPFIFRGALDVRARKINEEMKLAASRALAELAKQPVPAEVCRAYGVDHLEFGRETIVPKALDKRVLVWEAPAVAQAAMHRGVARQSLDVADYHRRSSCRAQLGPGVHKT